MSLYVDDMPQEARIIINGFREEGVDTAVEGFISSEISMSGSTDFSSGGLSSQIQDKIGNIASQVATTYTLLTDSDIESFQLKTVKDTLMMWQGSENFPLNIPLTFVAIDPESTDMAMGGDVRLPVRRLMTALYPSFKSGNPLTSVMWAPNKYKSGQTRNAEGALSVRIGRWFNSKGKKFLLRDANFSFSKETLRDGRPLYATGSIELVSFRILSGEEVAGMLGV